MPQGQPHNECPLFCALKVTHLSMRFYRFPTFFFSRAQQIANTHPVSSGTELKWPSGARPLAGSFPSFSTRSEVPQGKEGMIHLFPLSQCLAYSWHLASPQSISTDSINDSMNLFNMCQIFLLPKFYLLESTRFLLILNGYKYPPTPLFFILSRSVMINQFLFPIRK